MHIKGVFVLMHSNWNNWNNWNAGTQEEWFIRKCPRANTSNGLVHIAYN